jgi:hypothetical protein
MLLVSVVLMLFLLGFFAVVAAASASFFVFVVVVYDAAVVIKFNLPMPTELQWIVDYAMLTLRCLRMAAIVCLFVICLFCNAFAHF